MIPHPKEALVVLILLMCALLWTVWEDGVESGRREADAKAVDRMVKYRCEDERVYRKEGNYWVDTRQGCKTLEQLK